MAWLPDGEKISKISVVILAQLSTDGPTDGHGVTANTALICIASRGKKIRDILPSLVLRQCDGQQTDRRTEPSMPITLCINERGKNIQFWTRLLIGPKVLYNFTQNCTHAQELQFDCLYIL